MERPNYIPLEKDVRDLLKQMKGVKTYSEFLKKIIESYKVGCPTFMIEGGCA